MSADRYAREMIVMLIVFVTLIALGAAVPVVSDKAARYSNVTNDPQGGRKFDSLCETPECIHAASMLLKNMDQTVDPCVDFYQFACGKFIEETKLRDGNVEVSSLSMAFDEVEEQLRLGMAEEIKDDDPDVFNLLKSYYRICMNAGLTDRKKDVQDLLKNLGGWPVLEGPSWNETNFDWKRSVHQMSKMGFKDDIFVSVNIETDDHNSSRRIIIIQPAFTTIQLRDIINNTRSKYVRDYFKNIVGIAAYLGADRDQAGKELLDSLNFEVQLAKMSATEYQNIHSPDNRMTLQQLETNFSGILWSEYINGLIAPYAYIDPKDDIIVESPSFIDAFTKLITRTPKRTIANYGLSRALRRLAFLPEEHENNTADKCNDLQFKKEPEWKTCLDETSSAFEIAISSFYVRRFFDESAKINALIMIDNLKNSVHQLIYQAKWMDDETKRQALEKLNSMKLHVAYPNELINDENLNKYYKNLKLNPENYSKTKLILNRFKRAKEFSSLKEPVEETFWITLSEMVPKVNAQYHFENTMDIPAGILRRNIFNSDRPNYMNYGALGSVIGHELIHAFDRLGSLFDKNGNLVNWWKNETRDIYLEKAKCINEQYGNYYIKEINVTINGTTTLDENIADNGGFKASYYAYNQLINKKDGESRLPGLHYTPQQMFWISAANMWCDKVKPDTLEKKVTNDLHSPKRFRVIGALSNIPEFSKDFQCTLGSPMNPAKKCSVW